MPKLVVAARRYWRVIGWKSIVGLQMSALVSAMANSSCHRGATPVGRCIAGFVVVEVSAAAMSSSPPRRTFMAPSCLANSFYSLQAMRLFCLVYRPGNACWHEAYEYLVLLGLRVVMASRW